MPWGTCAAELDQAPACLDLPLVDIVVEGPGLDADSAASLLTEDQDADSGKAEHAALMTSPGRSSQPWARDAQSSVAARVPRLPSARSTAAAT